MPGVFTSRGCVACRKQKKRCQAEDDVPPCTRCKRLDIPCVGFGVRRFKFRDESEKVIAIHGDKNSEEDRSSTSSGNAAVSLRSRKDKKDDFRVIVFNAPSSVLTRLIAAYVRGIDPKADIAFQLPWNVRNDVHAIYKVDLVIDNMEFSSVPFSKTSPDI